MELKYGWAGKLLDVDLTQGKIEKKPIDETLALRFIGGRGFNNWLLFKKKP